MEKIIRVIECDNCPFNHDYGWCKYYEGRAGLSEEDRRQSKPRSCKVTRIIVEEE